MFGRRKRKREVVVVDAPDQWPVCGQVYLFNREREARERAESPPQIAPSTDPGNSPFGSDDES